MTDFGINHTDLRTLAAGLLSTAGADGAEAATVADILVWSDLAGRSTQGVWRLTVLLPRLRDGLIRSPCCPEFIRKTDGIAVMDGREGFGQYVGHVAMTGAIEQARSAGIGLV